MPKVLTMASKITCPHTGMVATQSSIKLRIQGQPVLLKDSISGKSVAGCTNPTDSNSGKVTCSLVDSVTAGEATKLTANSKPVMLDATFAGLANGKTGGNPDGILSVSANQGKLTAA